MFHPGRDLAAVSLAFGLIMMPIHARAGQGDRIAVTPATIPAPFFEATGPGDEAQRVDGVLEASAVEPIDGGRLLLVAHDKEVPLRVIDAATGRQVGPLLSSEKFPSETPKSSKWEAMARDSEGNYYLAGSHSGKTDDERRQHARLIRFRLKARAGSNGESVTVAVDDSSVVSWKLAAPLIAALQHEGLGTKSVDERKIEGLAIREQSGPDGRVRRELVIGLRQPDDLVRAFTADITTAPAPDSELPLTRLFAFDPGDREGVRCQLTSLEYVPAWKGFLAVTATEDDQNAFHGNTLWFVPDARIAQGHGSPIAADKVWTFEVAMKAEGLCVLPPVGTQSDPNALRLLITYDNDPHATHIPSRFQVVNLVRQASAN